MEDYCRVRDRSDTSGLGASPVPGPFFLCITTAPTSFTKQPYDAAAVMRQALIEMVADRHFLNRKSVTTLEVAEHILQQAAAGERDLDRLKISAFEKL
jgi:hypothetical protein